MREKKAEGGLMYMCSCKDEECNDMPIFSDGKLFFPPSIHSYFWAKYGIFLSGFL